MLNIIIGDYKIQPNDECIGKFSPDLIYKNNMGTSKRKVLFAEEAGITKDILKFISENATAEIVIVCGSRKITKGMRKSTKKHTITENGDFVEEMNPFELAESILTCKDRTYLFDFLVNTKPSLYMPIKALVNSYQQLSEHNRKLVAFLDLNQWRVNPEILYAIIAFKFKIESYYRFAKWNFPKKEEEKDDE